MTEKQVILSKREYDEMENELKELRKQLEEIINSRKISAIIRDDTQPWNRFSVQYIHGVEENNVIKILDHEIQKLHKEIKDYQTKLFKNQQLIMALNKKATEIKLKEKKPWYRKIF